MFDFNFKWWQVVLIFLVMVFANIVCFPIFLLQTVGINCKKVANWLCDKGFDQLTFYDLYSFKD